MYSFPIILFLVHGVLLKIISNKKKVFQDFNYLNSKQKFVIYSGILSYVVFIVQAINLVKTILELFGSIGQLEIFIIVLNYIFDLYPFLLLYYYRKYLGKSQN